MAKWEKASDSSVLFTKAPCQCNLPAGTQITSPSDNSITEDGEEVTSDRDFMMALLPSLLISILSTTTTIPFPFMATSVWSVGGCGALFYSFS